MSFERENQRRAGSGGMNTSRELATPGKRTLTQDLVPAPAVQKSTPDAASTAASAGSSSAGEQALETTVPFTATIQHAPNGSGESPGGERGPADGAPLRIAEMAGPKAHKETRTPDALSAAFTYLPTTTRGGVAMGAGEFGNTQGLVNHFSNVVITPGSGKFTITAELKQTVKWDTRATKGPAGQDNVASDTDPVLTKTSYPQAAKDLTPDISDLKGRPPRTKFWSKDLTEKHELFHVKDFVDIAKKGAGDAEKWLGGQAAAKKEDVPALLDTAWTNQIFTVWDRFTDPPAVEERAYSDGAPSYKARADSIQAKGDKGDYK